MTRKKLWQSTTTMGCLVSLLFVMHSLSSPDIFETNISPKGSDNFYEASCKLWLPHNAPKISALLVLLNGTDSDTRNSTLDPQWQDFAIEQNIALLGCHFRGDGEPYESAAEGSGEALLRMIDTLSERADRSDIRDAPLIFVGHSSGAMFSYNFACWKPTKTLAFVSIKSGPISTTTSAAASRVFGLFIVGEFDLASRVRTTTAAYLRAPGKDILWSLALEQGGRHGASDGIRKLTRIYIKDVLSLTSKQPQPIRSLDAPTYATLQLLDSRLKSKIGKGVFPEQAVWFPGLTSMYAWANFTKPINLYNFSRFGGTADNKPLAPTRLQTLELGKVGVRCQLNGLQKSFELKLPDAANIEYTCASKDPRIEIERFEILESGMYGLNIKLALNQFPPGYMQSSIIVTSSRGERFSLPITARISSSFIVRPSSLYVGVIPKDKISEMVVTILNDAGQPVKIDRIHSSKPEFAMAKEADKGKLFCRFDGRNCLGNQSGHFVVVLAETQTELRIPFIALVSKR